MAKNFTDLTGKKAIVTGAAQGLNYGAAEGLMEAGAEVCIMYCLAILLIRPRLREAAAIGLLAGAVCQFFPGTPYINFPSELIGALVMAAFARVTPASGKMGVLPIISTFVSTLASGFAFIGVML